MSPSRITPLQARERIESQQAKRLHQNHRVTRTISQKNHRPLLREAAGRHDGPQFPWRGDLAFARSAVACDPSLWHFAVSESSIERLVQHLPFSRLTAFSIATCTSLLSTAVERSRFVSVEAFSSHRFFDRVNTTTGSKFFFRRWPTRCTYRLLST